jgi:hypothetical protein
MLKSTIVLFSLILISCSSSTNLHTHSSNIKNVRYTKTTIRNIDQQIVYLNDGTIWKSNRLLIAVNLADVFVMLEEYINQGDLYFEGTKIGITLADGNLINYKHGYLNSIKQILNDGEVIELIDGSLWAVDNVDKEKVKSWEFFPEVIISEYENFLINPANYEFCKVSFINSDKKITQ